MLIGVDLPIEFVESVIMTGRLQAPHAPVSALVIGAPEVGKTTIVNNKKSKAIAVFTDVTGRGLVEACKLNSEISHFILNDLVAIMSHRQSVNKYTQAILNALTEEGVQAMALPGGIETIANGKRGVIACITLDLIKDGRSWWNKIGFASRMLPFGFSHSGELIVRIKSVIDEGKAPSKANKNGELRVPHLPIPVVFPEKYVKFVHSIADKKAHELQDPTGYRRLKQFRALVCGHALRRSFKKPVVGDAEIDFLNRIFPYISYTKLNPL
jgi:hypothetical protein